jgi:hypothetical protein
MVVQSKNKFFQEFFNKKLIYMLFFILLFVFVNIKISHMSFIGVFVNLFSVGLISILSIKHKRLDLLFFFFMLNILIGPFIFLNLYEIGIINFGRLDYLITNFVILYLILNNHKFSKSFFIFFIFLFLSFLFDKEFFIIKLDLYYGYFSKIFLGYLFFYFWKNIDNFINNITYKLFIYVLLFHLLLSIIQFIYPLYLRTGSIEASLHIFGVLVNRPLGLFESSYVYAVNTSFLLYMIYIYNKNENKNIVFIFLLILQLIIGFISARSALLATILYFISLFLAHRLFYIRILYVTIGVLFLLYLIIFNYTIFLQDQSNSTKFLLWYLTLNDFINNSTIFEILFGHGINSASMIANELPSFTSSLEFSVLYDNRIDDFPWLGFLIHNVYIQILYENGLLLFLFIMIGFFKIFTFILKEKKFLFLNLLFFIIFFQFFLHNGMYSSYIFFILFLFEYKQKRIYK